MATIDELKKKVITACRILDRTGVLDDLGHFSARCPDGERVIMNGSISPGQATEEDLVTLALDGTKLEGRINPPGEIPLHLAVYQKRPDVMAIAHCHSQAVITLSIPGIKLRAVENMGAVIFPPEVPLYEKYGLVMDFDMAYEVVETMGTSNIVSLKGHGNIVTGKTVEEACVAAIWTEKAARFQWHALQLGQVSYFPPAEKEKIRRDFSGGKAMKRAWDYFEWQLTQTR